MSELAREEILAVLEAWKKEFSKMQIWYEIDEEIYQAIRRLIETRPRVNRKFVEKWCQRVCFDSDEQFVEKTITMLRELGHEVEEEKEA